MNSKEVWIMDNNPDANGYLTIREDDGTPNGNIEAEPIATVFRVDHALLIANAPELMRFLCAFVALPDHITEDLRKKCRKYLISLIKGVSPEMKLEPGTDDTDLN